MIKLTNCFECRQCCNFSQYKGKKLSAEKLYKHFSFTKRLSEIFFNKEKELYIIEDNCKCYKNGKCSIYQTDNFPFACAAYPFMIAVKKDGNHKLVIDRNCRYWREAVNQSEIIHELIKKHQETESIDVFPEKDLIRMGYKILTIRNEISI